MQRIRGILPLVVGVGLVAAMGVVALRVSAQASHEAEAVHRRDRSAERATLSGLVNQYFQFGFKETFDYASTQPWSLRPGDPADVARLEAFANRSALLQHGAALVGLDQQPLSAYADAPGLPPATDPGYAPLVGSLLRGEPGLSSVMRVGTVPVVALGVPVTVDGSPRAVMLAYFRADESPLQGYTEGLRTQRPTATSFTLDARRVVVTSSDRSLVGTELGDNPALAHLAQGRSGFLDYRDGDRELTVNYSPVGLAGWSSLEVEPAEAFYGPIREGRQRLDRVLLGLLAVAAAIAIAFNHRVSRTRRRSEARYRALVQHASDITTVVDGDARILFDSPAMERLLGYRVEERLGRNGLEFVHPDDVERTGVVLADVLASPSATARTELRIRRRDGSYVWFECIGTNLLHDPAIKGLVVNLRDVTERREFEEELTHQAFHDGLTGLPNRVLFHDRLRMALTRRRPAGATSAVLFVDLDRFKVINDSLGHDIGDQVLIAVGQRLQGCLREQDTLARISGDEFTILLDEVLGESGAVQVAQRVIDELRKPLFVAGQEVFAGASIGIAVARPDQDAADLVREADLAMYRAKERGRMRCEVFAADMGDRARRRMELEFDLRRALDQGELRLHYQPEVDLADYRVVGFEALARWEHPRHGLLLPTQFIGLAEETGLIVPLGRWVLHEATRQCRHWVDVNPGGPRLRVSVNVSARQLQSQGFVATVGSALQESGIEPALLTLELTESVLLADTEAAIALMCELRELGVELAIDDFGTGYSSLNYLKHFPISELKLDRSFVQGLGDDSADAAIARSTIALAHSLGITVTAEGIELMEQLAQLQTMGCDRGQGYHFSRPVPSGQVSELLNTPVDRRS